MPKATIVSHKFGERELPNGVKQLHECGIVYHSSNPYLLCIMTKGHNLSLQSQFISGISALIYNGLEEKLKQKQF